LKRLGNFHPLRRLEATKSGARAKKGLLPGAMGFTMSFAMSFAFAATLRNFGVG
jgi:hypothetical protein